MWKKPLCLLLCLLLMLPLCACGKKQSEPGSAAAANVFGPPNPNLDVKITPTNLNDYFEYKEYKTFSEDEDGNINSVQISYGLQLREEYTALNDPAQPDTMKVTFTATGVVNKGNYEVDYDSLSYTGETYSTETETITETLDFWAPGNRTFTWAFGNYTKSYITYLEGFQILKAEGVVHLRRVA